MEEYTCLIHKAGGDGVPIWTGFEVLGNKIMSRYVPGEQFKSYGWERLVGDPLPSHSVMKNVLVDLGSDVLETNLKGIYLYKGFYINANTNIARPGFEKDGNRTIKCACAPGGL